MSQSKYIKIREEIDKAGISIKEYCERNSLCYQNVIMGISRLRRKEEEKITVFHVPSEKKTFQMSTEGIGILIEYRDRDELRKALEGLIHVFTA